MKATLDQLLFWFFLVYLTKSECSGTTPFECSDHTCVEDYEECKPFAGCIKPSKPFLCSNGECALNYSECKEKFFQCQDHTLVKCIDGICRESCDEIRHSSCPFNLGYRCPDGKCVKQLIECGCKINKQFGVQTLFPFGVQIQFAYRITLLVSFHMC
jgi:hypothetical protein